MSGQRIVEKRPLAPRDFAERVANTHVICAGLSALDQVWQVDTLLSGGSEKIRGVDYYATGGGMAANAAVTVARLGASVAFWGRGGNDPAGREMHQALSDSGVDVRQFRLFSGARSSVSGVIIDRSGERQIVNFRGRLPEHADWLDLNEVKTAAVVLADPRWVDGALALFDAARSAGIPTVLDAEVADSEVFETLLPQTDHAIFSAPALRGFAGPEIADSLARVVGFGCGVAAVTRGAEGVTWLSGNDIFSQRAYAVDAVDTTGAGDVFHGAYALAVGGGLALPEAISFASAAAALKCTRPGGRAAIPTLEDCLEFQRTAA